MKKVLYLFVAMLVALAANATETPLNPGNKVLYNAVAGAAAGDILVLADGVYEESEVIQLNKNITIKAADGAHPIIAQQYYMKLLSSAQVTFIGIKFDGGLFNNGKGANDHCIRPYDDTSNKTLTLIDCEFCNWKSYILYPQKAARCMQSLTLDGCYFHDNQRGAIYVETAPSATDVLPLAELTITNTTFSGTPAYKPFDVKNAGTETADVKVRVDHCTFYNCGTIRSEKSTDVIISNSIFAAPEDATYAATTLYAGAQINNCLSFNVAFNSAPTQNACIVADPLFADAANGDLRIGASSPALGAGIEGSDLGDPRWTPQINYYLIGNMNNWELKANYILEQNPENDAEYTIPMMLFLGDEFKITKSDGFSINEANSYPSGVDKKYQVTASGEYTVRFRPDGQGGEGWLDGYLYAQPADLGPWEAWFGNAVVQEKSSYLIYDSAVNKITAHIRSDKNTKAKIKYHGIAAEAGKCYRIAFKMKANRELNGITLIWQEDNTEPAINENRAIGLNEDEEFIYEEIVSGAAGNGILLFDFGVVSKGVIIEIYDVAIEEVECPAPPTYYLVGSMTDWAAQEEYKFTASESVEGEYILNTTLEAGCAIKVVGISEIKETWYPGGFDSEYVVDASHAGETTVYFRPAGNPEWTAFGGYFYMDAKQAIDHVEATAEQEKFIRDGQMYILIDGQVYNTLGQRVAQ